MFVMENSCLTCCRELKVKVSENRFLKRDNVMNRGLSSLYALARCNQTLPAANHKGVEFHKGFQQGTKAWGLVQILLKSVRGFPFRSGGLWSWAMVSTRRPTWPFMGRQSWRLSFTSLVLAAAWLKSVGTPETLHFEAFSPCRLVWHLSQVWCLNVNISQ